MRCACGPIRTSSCSTTTFSLASAPGPKLSRARVSNVAAADYAHRSDMFHLRDPWRGRLSAPVTASLSHRRTRSYNGALLPLRVFL